MLHTCNIFQAPVASPFHFILLDPIIPAMSTPPPPADPFSHPYEDDTDFGAPFVYGDDQNFSATFGFGADFGLGFDDFGFGADFGLGFDNFYGSSDDSHPPGDTLSNSDIDSSGGGRKHWRRRRQRCPNRLFRIESVKNSCWYRNFTRPGVTRELTHELSSSDRFGEFRQFFRMPLSKVEMLTDTLIQRGFVPTPRTKFRQAEFRERTELLVMSAIYILANGAAFRSCRTLCGICTSEVRKFFLTLLPASTMSVSSTALRFSMQICMCSM
jgi:hypothetical protein